MAVIIAKRWWQRPMEKATVMVIMIVKSWWQQQG